MTGPMEDIVSSSKVGVTYYVRGYKKGFSKPVVEVAFDDCAYAARWMGQEPVGVWKGLVIQLERECHSHRILKRRKE